MSRAEPRTDGKRAESTGPHNTGVTANERPVPWRKIAIVAACTVYLGAHGWFTFRYLLGDTGSHASAYFFTWDMFPGYSTESKRRYYLGVTRSGQLVQLLPAKNQHYRWGIHGTATRVDVALPVHRKGIQRYLKESIDRYNTYAGLDPIVKVSVVEQYWPSKFNLPDDLYQEAYGTANPRRRYWRVVREIPADKLAEGPVP